MTKVLIVHPDLKRLGGIETYFIKLCPHLKVAHESFSIARRPGESGLVRRISRILGDYHRFWTTISDNDIDIIHLNPSLEAKSFYREAIFFLMAKLRQKKTLVFFHGWNLEFQKKIDNNNGKLFRIIFGKADAFVVLASLFSDKLRSWGITQPIYSEVTVISDSVIADFDLTATVDARLETPRWTLLFPSRLMRSKGIATTILALKVIQRDYPEFELLVVGDGEFADDAKALVERENVKNVSFLGVVRGDKIYEFYRSAHILCFPTEHSEGLPNSIVEAMAFGLPVVTRPVGGIPDFFESGINGYLTESTAPEQFASLIIRIIEDTNRYRKMATNNHQYARSHFLSSQGAARVERIYASISC